MIEYVTDKITSFIPLLSVFFANKSKEYFRSVSSWIDCYVLFVI